MIDDWIIRNSCGDTFATRSVLHRFRVIAVNCNVEWARSTCRCNRTFHNPLNHEAALMCSERISVACIHHITIPASYRDIVYFYVLLLYRFAKVSDAGVRARPRRRDGECRAFLVLLLLFCKYYYRRLASTCISVETGHFTVSRRNIFSGLFAHRRAYFKCRNRTCCLFMWIYRKRRSRSKETMKL